MGAILCAILRLWRREDFSRIEQIIGIEGPLDIQHGHQFLSRMHHRHVLSLLDADAMLAAQASIFLDTRCHYFPAGMMHPLEQDWILWIRN